MIKFKDFITVYTNELWKQESLGEPAEPIEIWFNESKFFFAVGWSESNKDDFKKFISEEVYNSYVKRIWLNRITERIGIALTNEKSE